MKSNKDKNKAEEKSTGPEEMSNGEAVVNSVADPVADPVSELKDLLQRTQANFENYKKQTEKRISDIREMAAQNIITQILPVLDNFDLAMKNVTGDNEFISGIELIYSQLKNIMKEAGLEEIKTEGMFNAHLHEALMKVASEQPENTIIDEFQKGYILHGRVIRTARVKLSAGKVKSKTTEEIQNDK